MTADRIPSTALPFAPPVYVSLVDYGGRPKPWCSCGKYRLTQGRKKAVNEGLEAIGLRPQLHTVTKCTGT